MSEAPKFKRLRSARTGRTAILTLASDKVNALDHETLGEITTFVEWCGGDAEVGAIVVTGEGSVFSAGVNVNEVVGNDKSHTETLLAALDGALLALFGCPKPTVAAINGSAIAGGALLACACDQRLIAHDARIGVTELKVGVAFPIVALELLRHACGRRTEELVFGAQLVEAEEACRRGLAHRSVPAEELQAAALAAAEQLSALDPPAYALAKEASRRPALAAMEDSAGRALDGRVRRQWQDDGTRASLERLLKPRR